MAPAETPPRRRDLFRLAFTLAAAPRGRSDAREDRRRRPDRAGPDRGVDRQRRDRRGAEALLRRVETDSFADAQPHDRSADDIGRAPWTALARTLERGLIDALVIADVHEGCGGGIDLTMRENIQPAQDTAARLGFLATRDDVVGQMVDPVDLSMGGDRDRRGRNPAEAV